MKRQIIHLLCGGLLFSCNPKQDAHQEVINTTPSYVDYVDPIIGTSWKSNAGAIPAVTAPFGMTQFIPVTDVNKIGRTSYHYENEKVIGFMATHQPAPWMGDFGYLTLWPSLSEIKLNPDARGLHHVHNEETATPYFYKTNLYDSVGTTTATIQAEMTATSRCGYFKFIKQGGSSLNLVFEMSRQKGMETRQIDFGAKPATHLAHIQNTRKDNFEGWVKIDKDKNEIIGYNPDRHSYHLGPELKNFRGYFVIQISGKATAYGTWKDSTRYDNTLEIKGNHVGGYLTSSDSIVEVKVGTSFISIAQARENLHKEIGDKSFEELKENLKAEWNNKLKNIELIKGTEKQKTLLYTSLYHSLIYPNVFSEHGKYYSAFDEAVHEGVSYNNFSLWDTFRALHPLLVFVAPEETGEMITSLTQMYEEGGWIPKWPNPTYSNIMIGTHADAMIADAYVKGIKGVDYEKAYQAIRKNAFTPPDYDLDSTQWELSPWVHYESTPRTTANPWWDRSSYVAYEGRAGLTFYDSLGYVPQDKTRESVARTLEFAFNDYCVAQVAKGLGKTKDYDYLMARSKNYKNVYNPTTGLMAIKNSKGEWMKDSLKLAHHIGPESYLGFTEGGPYTYQFGVMHDIEGLIELMGDGASFINKLDYVFDEGLFVHTNEPGHHFPYLYNYADKPQSTQQKVRQYALSQYNTGPSGIKGNDDCGQMSAWYIFSALGFYPVSPSKTEYAIGSPMYEECRMNLANGKTFTIKTINNADENCYIKSMTLNGKPYDSFFIDHSTIMEGGEMVFEMTNYLNE